MRKNILDNKRCYPLYAFIISAILFLVVLKLSNILGPGNKSVLRSDLFVQYIAYIQEFVNNIKSGSSIWYSFSNYLGGGNILNQAYYVMCPLNLIFLNNVLSLEATVILVIAIKVALSAAAFQFYLQRCLNRESCFNVIIAVFYSLNGFTMAFHFNIMWLDVLYVLPILIWLIHRFVKTGKYFMLILCYAYMFVTNFYTAYIAGIFSGLVFLLILVKEHDYKFKGNIKAMLLTLLKFAGIVISAVLLTAALLLPTFLYLMGHKAVDNTEFSALLVTLPDVVNSLFVGQIYDMNNKVPFLYCGLASVGLALVFITSSKVNIKDKIGTMAILLIYVLSIFYLPLYKMMHAFDYPDYYGFRFSFVIIFILASMASLGLSVLEKADSKRLVVIGILSIVFYSFMISYQQLVVVDLKTNNQNGLLINGAFIASWLIALCIWTSDRLAIPYKRQFFAGLTVFIACVEITYNGYVYVTDNVFEGLTDEVIDIWIDSEREAEALLPDDGFYRVFVNNEICINSGNMFSYNSLHTFSTSDNYDLRVAASRLGGSASNRMLTFDSNLPVFNSLFSVKYKIDLPMRLDGSEVAVIPNDNILPLGYMVKSDIYELGLTYNCFENFNNMCKAMSGIDKDVYTMIDDYWIDTESVDYRQNGFGYEVFSSEDMADRYMLQFRTGDNGQPVYIHFYQKEPVADELSPTVFADEYGIFNNNDITVGGAYKCNSHLGEYIVQIDSSDKRYKSYVIDGVYMASYDDEAYSSVYDELSQNVLNITRMDNDYIEGTVTATEDKSVLFTSIPYDEAWAVYVDGVMVPKHTVVGNAFIGVELAPGDHNVTFMYVEKGSALGSIITILTVTIMLGIILIKIYKKNRR